MQRKWIMLLAVAATTLLAGCSDKHGELGNKNIRQNSITYDMNGNRIMNKRFANDQMNEMNRMDGRRLNSNNIIGAHKNYRLEMSSDIAARIAAMEEVDKSFVMLTDNNAYVAVTLKDSSTHTQHGTVMEKNLPKGRTAQSYMRPLANARPEHHGKELEHGLKQKVAHKVKQIAPQIEHVYVSASPDFVHRMSSYSEDVKSGHPIQAFITEFNAMVDRVFPVRPKP